MSDCEHVSGVEYARMEIKEFMSTINACRSLARLITIKREIDGIIYMTRICPRYKRLYNDLDSRREMIETQWDALMTFSRPKSRTA